MGSGGANDVASRAEACVVVTLARPERLPEAVAYVTSPGHGVVSVVTDKGVLRRHDGTLRVAAVPAGEGHRGRPGPRVLVAACGYEPEVARTVEELAPLRPGEVARPARLRPPTALPELRADDLLMLRMEANR